MTKFRTAGIALTALLSATLVSPILADGASDFQANVKKGQSTLDQIAKLIDGAQNRQASTSMEAGQAVVAMQEETYKCPACGMAMSAKKTDHLTQKVTIKGKTWYCCAGCDMSKWADKPAKSAGKKKKKSA